MLPYNRRVLKAVDWRRIHKKGKAVYTKDLVLKKVKNNLPYSRFGFVVGTKIDKRATERNQIKRRLRAIIIEKQEEIKEGHDIIFIVRPIFTKKNYGQLKKTVTGLLNKNQLFK